MYLVILIIAALLICILFGEALEGLFMRTCTEDDLAAVAKLGSEIEDFFKELAYVLIRFV